MTADVILMAVSAPVRLHFLRFLRSPAPFVSNGVCNSSDGQVVGSEFILSITPGRPPLSIPYPIQ